MVSMLSFITKKNFGLTMLLVALSSAGKAQDKYTFTITPDPWQSQKTGKGKVPAWLKDYAKEFDEDPGATILLLHPGER